ncbi:MAG TPA: 4-hydroxy-3-methylbut-2-enyl diphosphate reductase [Elusimicrobiota bacterium]|nr:4-hydroxy-3-methylbut-2-enyl diphosphate reductase [Elusimicrobiota bacterium]
MITPTTGNTGPFTILLARPRGFCAGVVRAIDIVEQVLQKYPPPIYVRKEIVHNKAVVESFRQKGVRFVDSLEEVPAGGLVVFSAHGVSPDVRKRAQERKLRVIDATCPLVTKVHLEVHRFLKDGYSLVLIGHADHDEVVGTVGEAPDRIHLVATEEDVAGLDVGNPSKIMILTQTTLSVDEARKMIEIIQKKYPGASTPPRHDICYATQNRQDAVKELMREGMQLLLVVGSQNSSNSRRLCEVARKTGVPAHLIDKASEIEDGWFGGLRCVGVTAGASAPEYLVRDVIQRLQAAGRGVVREVSVREEEIHFSIPPDLMGSQEKP